jgi:adenylate cyclase
MSEPSAQPIDFQAEGLLEGLEGAQRAERLVLLEELAAEGVPLSDLRRTTATGTIVYLPADRVIVGTERYTAAEVAELTGVEEAFLIRLRRAMGLPISDSDEPVYTAAGSSAAASARPPKACARCR